MIVYRFVFVFIKLYFIWYFQLFFVKSRATSNQFVIIFALCMLVCLDKFKIIQYI